MKKCNRCEVPKELTEFNKRGKNGYRANCKACDRQLSKDWYTINKNEHIQKVVGKRKGASVKQQEVYVKQVGQAYVKPMSPAMYKMIENMLKPYPVTFTVDDFYMVYGHELSVDDDSSYSISTLLDRDMFVEGTPEVFMHHLNNFYVIKDRKEPMQLKIDDGFKQVVKKYLVNTVAEVIA